jgi:PAS domain S-box-containing protein
MIAPSLLPQRRARVNELEARVEELRAALERSEAARRAAEIDLRATEERYLLALKGSQDGLWEWDVATGVVRLSPRWKGMLGYETHEIGDDLPGWRERIHPDDRAAFDAALTRLVEGRDARLEQELRLLHRDGRVRHVLSRAAVIRLDGGDAWRVIGLDTDVTRLKRVHAVLDAVADGTSGLWGNDLFRAIVANFGRALGVDRVFIAECADDPPTRARSLAAWTVTQGEKPNFEYELSGTPCEAVVTESRTCFYPSDVATLFPREAGYESYLGQPIIGSSGQVLGHLVFFHTRPLGDEVLMDRVYRVFLARAAAEIERLRAIGTQHAH